MIAEAARQHVLKAAQQAYHLGLMTLTSGNFSERDADDPSLIAITPTSTPYDELTPELIAVVDLEGQQVDGPLLSSLETPMHTRIYRERPRVKGIAHTHSVHATAFAMCRQPIPCVHTEGMFLGDVPVAALAVPGSDAMGQEVLKVLPDEGGAVLLANHGALVAAGSVAEAVTSAVLLEDVARTYAVALSVGRPVPLTEAEVAQMRQTLIRHQERMRQRAAGARVVTRPGDGASKPAR